MKKQFKFNLIKFFTNDKKLAEFLDKNYPENPKWLNRVEIWLYFL